MFSAFTRPNRNEKDFFGDAIIYRTRLDLENKLNIKLLTLFKRITRVYSEKY